MNAETLAEIENSFGDIAPKPSSFLVQRIAELKNKKLSQFDIEDLRLCIGQDDVWKEDSLRILISLAIVELDKNLLAEGDLYEGDLLQSILRVKSEFWMKNRELHKQVILLFEMSRDQVNSKAISDDIREKLLESLNKFNTI